VAVRPVSLGRGLGPAAGEVAATGENTCAETAYKAGFSYEMYLSTAAGRYRSITVAVAVCLAESGGVSNIYGCNSAYGESDGYYPPVGCPAGTTSVDRGLWQINNEAWSNVSDACAFQAQCNADAAWNASDHGKDWGPWSTYTSGDWESYIRDAESGMSGITVTLTGNAADKCLETVVGGGHDGGVVQLWTCDSSDQHQQWRVRVQDTGNPILESVGGGKCLDTVTGQGHDGGGVQLWACNSSDAHQRWWINGSGHLDTDGHADAELQNSGSARCLATKDGGGHDGGVVYQWSCDASNSYDLWH
jgi:hypothetical protein